MALSQQFANMQDMMAKLNAMSNNIGNVSTGPLSQVNQPSPGAQAPAGGGTVAPQNSPSAAATPPPSPDPAVTSQQPDTSQEPNAFQKIFAPWGNVSKDYEAGTNGNGLGNAIGDVVAPISNTISAGTNAVGDVINKVASPIIGQGSFLGNVLQAYGNAASTAPIGQNTQQLFQLLGGVTNTKPINIYGGQNGSPATDLYAGNQQDIDPTLVANLNNAYNKMQGDSYNLQTDQQKANYQADQTRYQAAKDAIEQYVSQRQLLGNADLPNSNAYREAVSSKGAQAQAAQNFLGALKGKTPQVIDATIGELEKQGLLADAVKRLPAPDQNGIMNAASNGTLEDYMTKIGPVASARIIKGIAQGVYDNAGVEFGSADRMAQRWNMPTTVDPLYGKSFSDVIPSDQFNSALDNLDIDEKNGVLPISAQREAQQSEIASESGKTSAIATYNNFKGIWNGLSDVAKDALTKSEPILGAIMKKGDGGAFKSGGQAAAPNYTPAQQAYIQRAKNGDMIAQKDLTAKGINWSK